MKADKDDILDFILDLFDQFQVLSYQLCMFMASFFERYIVIVLKTEYECF